MKILITAFEPFDERPVNSSMLLLNQLELDDIELTKVVLPVTYDTSKLELLMNTYQDYDAVLHLGEAAARKKISLESIAINKQGATIKDNLGVFKQDEEIIKGAPIGYETSVLLKSILDNINDSHLEISYHAGTYICNLTYYQSLNFIAQNLLQVKCLFIHYPLFSEHTLLLEEALTLTKKVIYEIKKAL